MSRKSPYDIRSVNPDIIRIVLIKIIEKDGNVDYDSIHEQINNERMRGNIQSRQSRATNQNTDEIVELAWFGLVEPNAEGLTSKVPISDFQVMLNDLNGKLEEYYYKKEILYRLVVDELRLNSDLTEDAILKKFDGLIILTRSYPGYGLPDVSEVAIRFNKAKLSYILRTGRKLGSIKSNSGQESTGRKVKKISNDVKNDIRIIIVKKYAQICGHLTFVSLSDLFYEIERTYPEFSQTEIEAATLSLKNEYYPSVDLYQSSGGVTVYDPLLQKYYHHIRIEPDAIPDIIRLIKGSEA